MNKLKATVFVSVAVGLLVCIALAGVVRRYVLEHPMRFPGPGNQDYSGHLAGDYWLHRTSPYQIIIASEGGRSEGNPIIPTIVTQCATDGRYILAERHGLKRRSPGNPADTYEVEDPSQVDYWILDVESRKLHGPLDQQQFGMTRASLSINPALELRGAYEFRDVTREDGGAAIDRKAGAIQKDTTGA